MPLSEAAGPVHPSPTAGLPAPEGLACEWPGSLPASDATTGPSLARPWPGSGPLHVVMVAAAADPSDRASKLAQALQCHAQAGGRRVLMHAPPHPSGLVVAARQAASAANADGGVVLAIGGDGTINTVGHACWAAGVALAVVAQGTFNFFARQQGLPQDLDEALAAVMRALADGQLRPVQVGQVNGQLFLVNASLGLYPRLLAEREQATRRFGRHRLVALLAGVASLLRPHFGHRLRLLVRDEHGQSHRSERLASTLFVGNNALQLDSVGLPEAVAVQQGALGAVALTPQPPLGMLRLLWRAWRGRLADDPAVHNLACSAITVLGDRHRLSQRIKVAFDGESRWMALPVAFAVAPRPLWLVASPAMHAAVPAPGGPSPMSASARATAAGGLARA